MADYGGRGGAGGHGGSNSNSNSNNRRRRGGGSSSNRGRSSTNDSGNSNDDGEVRYTINNSGRLTNQPNQGGTDAWKKQSNDAKHAMDLLAEKLGNKVVSSSPEAPAELQVKQASRALFFEHNTNPTSLCYIL